MTLRDELLKAGLISSEKANKAETDSRKRTHRAKKDKALALVDAARQAERRRRLEAEAERKRERDRQLNREREAQKQRKDALAKARQLIDGKRLSQANGEIRYHFVCQGRAVRSVWVTEQQQKLLAMGRIGIACKEGSDYDFSLLPREAALKLAEICPEQLLLLHPESNNIEADD